METNHTQKNKFLSSKQKYFIGSTFSAIGIVFASLSVMFLVTLSILVKFKLSILFQALATGDLFVSLALALLASGIIAFAIGTTLQEK
jgi:hypothetical protein